MNFSEISASNSLLSTSLDQPYLSQMMEPNLYTIFATNSNNSGTNLTRPLSDNCQPSQPFEQFNTAIKSKLEFKPKKLTTRYSDLNIYRYYLSQYPQLFDLDNDLNKPNEPTECNQQDNSTNGATFSTDFTRNSNPTGSIHTDGFEEDNLASQLLYLSLKEPKFCKAASTDMPGNNHSGSNKKCCFLCRCSKQCQSDSSIWSLSEPDISQFGKEFIPSNSDNNYANPNEGSNNNNLLVNCYEERYAHLSRVITPPNAFLSNTTQNIIHGSSTAPNGDDYSIHLNSSSNAISYSNKVTQTDRELNCARQKPKHISKSKLQRHFSLVEPRYNQPQVDQTRLSVDSDQHIYHTINDQQQWGVLTGGQVPESQTSNIGAGNKQLKLNEIKQKRVDSQQASFFQQQQQRQQSASKLYDSQIPPMPLMATNELINSVTVKESCKPPIQTKCGYLPGEDEEEHRLPTSKNGIPCQCNRCRDSRGLNLTTELLPLDAQLPFHHMDNFDSFLQDNSMTELICTIQ